MMDSVIARLEKSAVVPALHEQPAFSELFIAHLLGRTIRVEADLVDQLFNSSEKRLARMLLLLANFGKESKPEPIIAKISQETLAEMIGTTRSRVSFFMNKFRELGFIAYNGSIESGIEVHSSLLNVVLHDQPQIKILDPLQPDRSTARSIPPVANSSAIQSLKTKMPASRPARRQSLWLLTASPLCGFLPYWAGCRSAPQQSFSHRQRLSLARPSIGHLRA